MKAVVQRVKHASVRVAGREISRIGPGLLVLLGIAKEDTHRDVRSLADRIVGLRIFADSAGKMNLDLKQTGGELLVVSQFTLLADTSHGRRPSFTHAAPPAQANALYQEFIDECRRLGFPVAHGEFGAMMEVELLNDGPVTLVIESHER